jgi:hypothetical protein
MRWRTLRVAILVFQALWLNVIVPGHRRGAVALPGEACAACEAPAPVTKCCEMEHGRRQDAPVPRGDPARHCAICFFAARVTPPDVIDLTPPPLRFAHQVALPSAEIRTSMAVAAPYDGRGPPVS